MQHLDEGTLQAWLDGARSGLDPSRLDSIERHIAACDLCASRADALERSSFRTHALLSVGRDQYAPRVPYEDVVRRAHAPGARERLLARRIPATWAASIVAALAVGWMSNELYSADAVQLAATSSPAALAQSSGGLTPPGAPSTELAGALASVPSTQLADADLLVSGVVADEGGRPVPSAQVYVANLAVGVLTEPDGSYDLRLPAEPDSFELTVQRIGFRQQVRAITAGEGDYVAADFRLREEALTLDEIVVTGESEGVERQLISNDAARRMRAAPFVWRALPSIAVEGYLGSDLWRLPGLDVLTLEVAYGDNPNETHVARVRQRLGDGTVITFIEGRTDARRTAWPVQSTGAVGSTWRGEMLITATAPVSADSLATLLAQLR